MVEYGTDVTNAPPQAGTETVPHQITLSKATVSGQSHASLLSSAGIVSTGRELIVKREEQSNFPGTTRLTKGSPGIKLAFQTCIGALDTAAENDDDIVLKSNALSDLQEALGRLWQARAAREEQFGDLVSHVQGLLLKAPAEDLRARQLVAIREVVRRSSHISELTDADLRDFERILIKAGCDVFREMQ